MPSQRDIKNKVSAVKKTRQITRAMNMVAAAKLRVIQEKTERFQLYAENYTNILNNLTKNISSDIHPFLIQPKLIKKIGLILITSDRGLCGSFNMNLINASIKFAREHYNIGQEIKYFLIGRKAYDYYNRRNININKNLTGVMNSINFDLAVQIARIGVNAFLNGEVDEVYLIYSYFRSMTTQITSVTKLLPLVSEKTTIKTKTSTIEYLTEPPVEQILTDFLPHYINVTVYSALLNTATSEQAARMTAMDNATKNCKEMINILTLAYNKARQAAITAELMDIVGGAEALKG